ncbi:MAG: hypothetical protein D6683_09325 [Actinomyces sp.]|nr:MAG: hypothetical protein D6683_09325 [Actinomyces sp.]
MPRVLFVRTPGCPHCRRMEPEVAAARRRWGGRVVIEEVDATRRPELVAALGIRAAPTFVAVTADGRVAARATGATDARGLDTLADAARGGRPGPTVPRVLALTRLVSGLVLTGAGVGLGGIVLTLLGVALVVWGGVSLVPRRPAAAHTPGYLPR